MVQNLSGLVNALPADLLQDRETFDSIINRDVLEQLPQSKLTAILNKHLPASLSEEDKRKTASDLFDNNLHFLNINQMDHFYKQAKIHKFKPDLVKHLNELKSLKKKAYRLEEKKLQCKLLNEIIVKKRLLIKRALNNNSPLDRTDQLHHHHHHHHSNSSIAHLELAHRVDERYHKELEAIDLDNSLRLDPLKPANGTDHNEVRNHPPVSTTYSVDDQEYFRLLKNFKRKKLKNEVDEARFDDLSMKTVLDRVLESSPEFEAKLVSLNEQPKSDKRKKKIVKKSSVTNAKQRKVSNQAKPDSDHPASTTDHRSTVQPAHQKPQVVTPNDRQQTPTIRAIREPTDSRPDASANGAKENEHINKLPAVNQQEAPKPFSLSSIPPSVCSTDWTVSESTATEKEEYRRQEVMRYRNPNKAFTFNLHSYKSVVGPVKNCTFIKESANASKVKNRTTILKERPPHVTYLSLVRDSAARLPNGQGTRSDIVCLMKDSQYLREDLTDEQISGIVSGALDRLHYEVDPAVLYDSSSKLWVYCHRNRTEEQFNSLHEANLAKKVSQKAPKKSLNATKKVSQKAPDNQQVSPKTVNGANDAERTSSDDRREPDTNNHRLDQLTAPSEGVQIERTLPTVAAPANSQFRTVNISQAKLINLSHEDPKVNANYNINIKHQPSNKSLESVKKDGSGKEKSNGTKKAVTAGKQVQIKPKISKPDETAAYATTFSNLRLINESIKQKYRKPTAKKLKTEQSSDEQNGGGEITRVIISPAIGNEVCTDQTGLKQPANHQLTQQARPVSDFTALPILSPKPEKDEAKPIVMSNNTGISLSGANVILNPSNCPLILSSGANGYTAAFTMTKNGNQYFICPQNTTISNSILKSKALAGQKIQTMHLVPFNSVQQSGQGLAAKSQPIVAKIIPKPAQISMSSSSSQPTKSIICSPSLISTKAPNL